VNTPENPHVAEFLRGLQSERPFHRGYIRLLEGINLMAEIDMLSGNPITGAHHRAIEKTLQMLKGEEKGEEVNAKV